MIKLIPAIDIIDGRCVRLTKGNYNEKTIYHENPVDVAKEFEQLGLTRLHLVDLDGAKSDHVINIDVLKAISTQTNLHVDFSGGIKSDDDIKDVFNNGANMVTIGSVAVNNPYLFNKWLKEYGPQKIILGADIKNGSIAINGWKDETKKSIYSFLEHYISLGIINILCTDITKDGTLSGPAYNLYTEILRRFPEINLIASGGVSSNEDIIKLDKLGVKAVVFGKAYYEHKIDIKTLMQYV
jgi:phosphoribosylformimino-5-aminoimidazole carboxamide ribotide isomerase